MTMALAIALVFWTVLLPGLVVWLRLRCAAAPAGHEELWLPLVGNSAHPHQRGRLRRVPCQATHVDSRRARHRIGHASGGCAKRH